ncbi:MAG: shikimate kinase [Planctomycetaceae bacterium]
MIITLIGYRGSGKSAVARPLAERLAWSWIDADAELERRAGRTIRAIFEQQGEAEFRRLERELLAELLQRDELVLAAGGGAVLNADTRRDLHAAGPVVWLRAPVEVLEQRIHADRTTADRRPNLTAGGGRAEIEAVLRERAPLYRECASLTIETGDADVAAVVERILSSLPEAVGRRGP